MKRIVFTLLLTTALAVPVASHAETYQTNRSGIDFPFFDFGGDRTVTTTQSLGKIDHSRLDRTLIQAVQQDLTDAGYYKGGVDGVWDLATSTALAGYQGSEGYMPTGQLDEQTLMHMGLVMPASDQIASQSRPLANAQSSTVYVVTRDVEPRDTNIFVSGRDYTRLDRSEVVAVQRALADDGYYMAGIDGIWGPKTAKGLRDFQAANNIAATGRLNNQTIAELGLEVNTTGSNVSRIEPASGGW
jgi:peptidoglycan hydrolase-like protein with peptidoglycan-binding domain